MSPRLRDLSGQRSAQLLAAGVGVVVAVLIGAVVSPALGKAAETQHGELYLWLGTLFLAAAVWYVVLRYTDIRDFSERWAPLPITIVVITDSIFSTHGTNATGTSAHQAGWALLGVTFGYAALVRRRIPAWLITYALLGVALQLAVSFRLRVVPDIGLSAVALLVMWMVALALRRDGGVVRFVGLLAIGYWVVTALGVFVYFTHLSIGRMAPATVEMPWQGGLHNILVNGNVTGYGFISGQGGREASFVVCTYHFMVWRFSRDRRQLWLSALAFALFISGYGRIALVGGALGFVIVLLTNDSGTRAWRLFATSIVGLAVIVAAGLPAKLLDLSSRSGNRYAASGSSGHLSLWSQHLNLFLQDPLTGVGSNATVAQSARARFTPLFKDQFPATIKRLNTDGSRGEGGWTGLVAQRGVVNGGALLALIAAAIAYCLRPFPSNPDGRKDMTLVRAIIAASVVFYVTDEVPFSIYTVTSYVLGQVAMIAAVRALGDRRVRRTATTGAALSRGRDSEGLALPTQ